MRLFEADRVGTWPMIVAGAVVTMGGTLSWTAASGGTAAFHLGLIVLSAAAAAAVLATLADRPRTAN